MDIDIEGVHPGGGLFRKWFFRILLLVAALACFLGNVVNISDRWQLSHGVSATIKAASKHQEIPRSYSEYEGKLRAVFDVKILSANGTEFITQLFLPKEVVENLIQGGSVDIVYVKDNPRRHLIKGDALPPYGVGLFLAGLAFLAVFCFSLKLR